MKFKDIGVKYSQHLLEIWAVLESARETVEARESFGNLFVCCNHLLEGCNVI